MEKNPVSTLTSKLLNPEFLIYFCPQVATLAPSGNSGRVYITFNGSPPCPAENYSLIDSEELIKPENIGRKVMVMFENADPLKPKIYGLKKCILDRVLETQNQQCTKTGDMTTDKDHLCFEAKKEISFVCGKGSLTMNEQGAFTIQGTDILTNASGDNAIQGTRVIIN